MRPHFKEPQHWSDYATPHSVAYHVTWFMLDPFCSVFSRNTFHWGACLYYYICTPLVFIGAESTNNDKSPQPLIYPPNNIWVSYLVERENSSFCKFRREIYKVTNFAVDGWHHLHQRIGTVITNFEKYSCWILGMISLFHEDIKCEKTPWLVLVF